MYQNIGGSAYKKDLSNIILICEHLNNPQNNFKSIHVGGTNGKGSCSHMLSSILQEAGYNVGLYTSPHLVDFRERIRINGEMISKDSVSEFWLTVITPFNPRMSIKISSMSKSVPGPVLVIILKAIT